MVKKAIACLFLFLVVTSAFGQDGVLDKYIAVALEKNLALRQQDFSFQKSMAALREARGMFLPSIGIDARYSRAGGGRMIDIPVGDLVNPVYQTLNQILGQQYFPTNIPNESVPFLRKEEQETKVRLVQPIFQPALIYNYKIKSDLSNAQESARDVYARQLVAEVKKAYFNYLKTVQVALLYKKTEVLLNENLRVSEKLFENQKVTKEAVYRAQTELSSLQQEIAEAQKNRKLASAYFNFLLNRALNDSIGIVDAKMLSQPAQIADLKAAEEKALEGREELRQIYSAANAAKNSASLSKSAFLPGLSVAVDYGIQGEKYRFTSKDDYWMASAVMQWNLFNGFQDKARIQQAQIEKKKLVMRNLELQNQIRLEVRKAFYELEVARKSLSTARDRLRSARESFQIMNRKYAQGMALQIEYLDSQNALTRAEINEIITSFDYRIGLSELERATASYPISEKLDRLKR